MSAEADERAPAEDAHLRRLDRLFQQALALDGPERTQWLERECPAVDRTDVERLLADLEVEDTVVRAGGAVGPGTLATLTSLEVDGRRGRIIGRYRILEKLGEGGVGVVYLAERADGAYRQRVAVKVLRLGSDQHSARRFALERQILAALDHPNIARLLDGGTTEDGEHYLVVEHVEGSRIDQHCDGLDTRQTLELFCRLCSAVQEAHRRLIVHRDIKPSNILVTESGEPKLLDFGIAKLVGGEGPFEAAPTRSRHRVMTVQYASPEQYRGEPVTVASDVYQLGLVAYEVLTGIRPYSVRSTHSASVEKLITDIDPPPPSQRALQHDATRARELEGDLDTILLKALRKEPEERYRSVDELREDVERFLAGLPVRARKPSWRYVAAKFVRRNVLPLGVAALVLATVATVSTGFLLRLSQERDRTREAARRARIEQAQAEAARVEAENLVDLVVDIFGGASPELNRGRELSAAELLDRGVESIGDRLLDQPRAHARLLATLGRMNRELGRLEESADLQRRAIGLTETRLASSNELDEAHRRAQTIDLADYYRNLAALLAVAGDRRGERPALLERAQEIVETEIGPASREAAYLMMDRADLELDHGNLEPAEVSARKAVEILVATDGPEAIETAAARRTLGLVLLARGELEEAEPELERALELFRELRGKDSPAYATVLEPLARIADSLGRTERAGALFAECAETMRRTLPTGHGNLVISLLNHANWLQQVGRYPEARVAIGEALEELRAGPDRAFLEAAVLDVLGATQLGLGEVEAGVATLRRVVELWESTLPSGGVHLAGTESRLAEALLTLGRLDEAERLFVRSRDRLESIVGPNHLLVSNPLLGLGRLCERTGRLEEAEHHLERALALRAAVQEEGGPDREEARRALMELRDRHPQLTDA